MPVELRMVSNRLLRVSIVLGIVFALGCAADRASRKRVMTSDGLVQMSDGSRSKLWVKPDHHIGRYDQIFVSRIGFDYGRGQSRLDEKQEYEIAEMLSDALSAFTDSGPVSAAKGPGPCVVSVVLGLKDLQFHEGGGSSGSNVSYVASFGSATMIVEFRDSMTNVPLLRYAANRGLGAGPSSGQKGADLKRLGKALGGMVTDMTNELQTITPDTTERREHGCNDGIYKLTGRG